MDRLEGAVDRRVQLVELAAAERSPLLLADVLRDGRVLVDRDGEWPKRKHREQEILAEAERANARLDDDVAAALTELGVFGR